ncbi:cyclophane-forming radical SAM peptide maturase AmcB [Streptomyces sp. NPDC048018]|uniref:cyclophane-forming radical SAM peptide maturase AmcB n=1 Tax=Streptomyces sp. NPDC048018 TaxID=3365499 RepID=UPI0037210E82
MTDLPRTVAPAALSTTAALLFVQPTTLCNLDCSYCYLPDRARARTMPAEVADAVATGVRRWADRHPVHVLWHGGEPLTVGPARFERLLDRFRAATPHPVTHGVQTNATLIDDSWCELFTRRAVHVSVSLDGPQGRNAARVDRAGRDSTARALDGIRALRTHGIPFSAIAVAPRPSAAAARELYDWFAELGCTSLGVNLVERKGVHVRTEVARDAQVVDFWAALTARTESDGRLRIRDIDHALRFVRRALTPAGAPPVGRPYPLSPMVAWNGDVTPIGPELAGFSSPDHGRFTVGNVLDGGLAEVTARARHVPWVAEAMRGVSACRAQCEHFAFCGGGNPANKYFETGRFDVTETAHCRAGRKALMEGMLHHVAQG